MNFRIGDSVRLSHWGHCCFVIEDIGTHSMWGRIIDIKTTETMLSKEVFPLDFSWIRVWTSDDVLTGR